MAASGSGGPRARRRFYVSPARCYLDWAIGGGPEPRIRCAVHQICSAAVAQLPVAALPRRRAPDWADRSSRRSSSGPALAEGRQSPVHREEVRREAQQAPLDAGETQALLDVLVRAGWLREITANTGRPARGRSTRGFSMSL